MKEMTFRVSNGNLNLSTYATLVTVVTVVTKGTLVTGVTVVTEVTLVTKICCHIFFFFLFQKCDKTKKVKL